MMFSMSRFQQEDQYEDQGSYKPQRRCYDAQSFNGYNYGYFEDYSSPSPRKYRTSQEENRPRNPAPLWAQYDDQEMAYDDYYNPRRNKSHYEEPQDHNQDQYEGYEDYIPQEGYNDAQSYGPYLSQAPPIEDGYHNAPSQNLYSQKAYPYNSYSKNIQHSQTPQNEKYFPYTQDEYYPSYAHNPQYPPYSQDHQDYPYYSNHYKDEEYTMQAYEGESKEEMRNQILAMLAELKQDMTHFRQEWKQELSQEISSLRQEIAPLKQETKTSLRDLENRIAQVAMWANEWENICVEEMNIRDGVVEKEIEDESDEDLENVWDDEELCGDTFEPSNGVEKLDALEEGECEKGVEDSKASVDNIEEDMEENVSTEKASGKINEEKIRDENFEMEIK
ncbi:PREDICTED: uncharacterized protein LOC109169483 [Ipomoea nil]|uniref:uncharacterized protein LOC109169483 n=1 Tax=Ipomoea nil TaxID=35883 RepID=UPI00090175B6|nr:PREDICTED: uncharacterized protein LOC109169483 [Ipomoea nil]